MKPFFRFFPTPSYLRMPSIGFDLSDRSVKYASFDQHGRELLLAEHGKLDIPEGLVISGKIVDTAGLKAAIIPFAKRVRRKHVRVSLPEEQIYLFTMTLPLLEGEEVRSAILLHLEEHIPIGGADAIFDYNLIARDKENLHLEVAATSSTLIESYQSIFEGTGLVPLSFELEAHALARAVVPSSDERTVMVIDLGETRTGLSIVSRGVVLFTSTIDIGGHHLSAAIAKYFSISLPDAISRKETYGISAHATEEGNLMPAVVGPLSGLRDEINKHYIFWGTHPFDDGTPRPSIDALILSGGEANMKGLAEYFTETLRVTVEKANPWVNIADVKRRIPDLTLSESLAYATAFGLALGDTVYD